MMSFELNANTKMALRAVVVAIACIIITREFPFERAYWTFLTAFMLITQSFGDGIYRSLVRFIMTILGCLLGWVIYLPFADKPAMLILITFIALFFMLYWFTTSLIGRNLATGVLLVASFGLMNGGWTFHMLTSRIFDTFIGAAIAIFVNGLILPEFSKATVKILFNELRPKLISLHDKILHTLDLKTLEVLQANMQELEKERLQLAQNYQLSRYEILFRQQKKQVYKNMLIQTDIVFSYLNALLDIKIAETSGESQIKQELAKSGETYYQERIDTELKKLSSI